MRINDLINGIRNNMFASRPTLQEAYEYATQMANACGSNSIGVITATHVVLNTMANTLEVHAAQEKELIETLRKLLKEAEKLPQPATHEGLELADALAAARGLLNRIEEV